MRSLPGRRELQSFIVDECFQHRECSALVSSYSSVLVVSFRPLHSMLLVYALASPDDCDGACSTLSSVTVICLS